MYVINTLTKISATHLSTNKTKTNSLKNDSFESHLQLPIYSFSSLKEQKKERKGARPTLSCDWVQTVMRFSTSQFQLLFCQHYPILFQIWGRGSNLESLDRMIKTVLAEDKSVHTGVGINAQAHLPKQMVSWKMFWSIQLILPYEEWLPIWRDEWRGRVIGGSSLGSGHPWCLTLILGHARDIPGIQFGDKTFVAVVDGMRHRKAKGGKECIGPSKYRSFL